MKLNPIFCVQFFLLIKTIYLIRLNETLSEPNNFYNNETNLNLTNLNDKFNQTQELIEKPVQNEIHIDTNEKILTQNKTENLLLDEIMTTNSVNVIDADRNEQLQSLEQKVELVNKTNLNESSTNKTDFNENKETIMKFNSTLIEKIPDESISTMFQETKNSIENSTIEDQIFSLNKSLSVNDQSASDFNTEKVKEKIFSNEVYSIDQKEYELKNIENKNLTFLNRTISKDLNETRESKLVLNKFKLPSILLSKHKLRRNKTYFFFNSNGTFNENILLKINSSKIFDVIEGFNSSDFKNYNKTRLFHLKKYLKNILRKFNKTSNHSKESSPITIEEFLTKKYEWISILSIIGCVFLVFLIGCIVSVCLSTLPCTHSTQIYTIDTSNSNFPKVTQAKEYKINKFQDVYY